MKTITPYAFWLASAKQWTTGWVGWLGKWHLLIQNSEDCFKSVAISNQSLARSSLSGLSQLTFSYHIVCRKILARITTGEINPRGSKILEVACSTSLLVTKWLHVGIRGFDTIDSKSVVGVQQRPKMLTVLWLSMVFSRIALAMSSLLLEDQLRRLNFALDIMARAVL